MLIINQRVTMTYSVLSIADEILRIAKSKGHSLKPLKLMKLTYISFGWHLAIKKRPLFSEDIEAWKYGPVMPDLYRATKKFGRNSIPMNLIEDEGFATDIKTREFLEDVYEKYGSKSGIYLSNLTHKSGTPWHKVFRPNTFNIDIPHNLIENHYKNELSDRPNTNAT